MLLASIGCACCSGSASFGRRSGQDEIQLRGSDADGNEPKKRRNCRLVTQSRRQLVSARLTSALSGFLKKPCRSSYSLIVVFIGCQTTDSSERGIFPDWELRLREMNLLRLNCVEISSPSLLTFSADLFPRYEGKIGMRRGIFPCTYVEVLSEPGSSAPPIVPTTIAGLALPSSSSTSTSPITTPIGGGGGGANKSRVVSPNSTPPQLLQQQLQQQLQQHLQQHYHPRRSSSEHSNPSDISRPSSTEYPHSSNG